MTSQKKYRLFANAVMTEVDNNAFNSAAPCTHENRMLYAAPSCRYIAVEHRLLGKQEHTVAIRYEGGC